MQQHSDGKNFYHDLWLKLFSDETPDHEKQEIQKKIDDCFEKHISKTNLKPHIKELKPLLNQEKQNFQEILLHFVDIFPISNELKDIIKKIVYISEALLLENTDRYCEVFVQIITYCLEHLPQAVIDSSKEVVARNFVTVLRETFILEEEMRLLALNLFITVFYKTQDLQGKCVIDLVCLINLLIKDDIYSGVYTPKTSAITTVTNFVMDLLEFQLQNSEELDFLTLFEDEELKNLTSFFMNKFSNRALNLKLQIKAGEFMEKLCRSPKPVRSQLQTSNANSQLPVSVLEQLETSATDQLADVLKNIMLVLTSRLKLVVEEEICLIFRSDLREKTQSSYAVGNLGGYNKEFLKHPCNDECFSNRYQDYYNLIDVVLTTARSVTSIYLDIIKAVAKSREDVDFDPILYKNFLCLASKALSFFPTSKYFKESPSKTEGYLNLAVVFSKFSPKQLQVVLRLSIKDVLDSILKNSEVMFFLLSFLHEPSTLSTAVIEVLLNYLSEQVKKIGDDDDTFNMYLDILETIRIVSFNAQNKTNSGENKEVFILYLPAIKDNIFKVIEEAEEPDNYLLLLRCFLLCKENNVDGDKCAVKWCDTSDIKEIFERIKQYLKSPMRPKHRDLLIEMCLDIIFVRKHHPNDFELEPSLPELYLQIIVSSLSTSESLILKGVKALNTLLRKWNSFCKDMEKFQEMKSTINKVLLPILKYPSNTNIKTQIYHLPYLEDLLDLKEDFAFQKSQFNSLSDAIEDGENNIDVSVYKEKKKVPINIDKAISPAYEVLCMRSNTKNNADSRDNCWNLIKTFLAHPIRNSDTLDEIKKCLPPKGTNMKEFRSETDRIHVFEQEVAESLRKIALDNHIENRKEQFMRYKELGITPNMLKNIYERFQATRKNQDESNINKRNHLGFSDPALKNGLIHKTAFCAMFARVTLNKDDQDALLFFENVIHYYTLLAVTLESNPSFQIRRNVVNPVLLLDAFIDYMSTPQLIEKKSEFGTLFLKTILNSAKSIFSTDEEEEFWKFDYFTLLFEKICNSCKAESSWEKKFGCEALSFLLDLKHENWKCHLSSIVRTLFYVIESSTDCISEGVIILAKKVLDKIVENICQANIQNEYVENILKTLFAALTNPSEAVRTKAHSCLHLVLKFLKKEKTEANFDNYVKDEFCRLLKDHFVFPLKILIGLTEGFCLLRTFKENSLTEYFSPRVEKFSENLLVQCKAVIGKEFKSLQKDEKKLFESSMQFLCIVSSKLKLEKISDVFSCIIYALKSNDEKMYVFGTSWLHTLYKSVSEKEDYKKLLITPVTHHIESVLERNSLSANDAHVVSCFMMVFHDECVMNNNIQPLKTAFQVYLNDWFSNRLADCNTEKYIDYVKTVYSLKDSCFWFCNIHPGLFSHLILLIQQSDLFIHYKHFDDNFVKQMACYNEHAAEILKNESVYGKKIYPFFEYLLKSSYGKEICIYFEENPVLLIEMLKVPETHSPDLHLFEHQCCALRIIGLINEHNKPFIITNPDLVTEMLLIWKNTNFKSLISNADFCNLEEYMTIAKCLLNYISLEYEMFNVPLNTDLLILIFEKPTEYFQSQLATFRHFSFYLFSKLTTLEKEKLFENIFVEKELDEEKKINILRSLILPYLNEITKQTDEKITAENVSFEMLKILSLSLCYYIDSDNTTPDKDLTLLQLLCNLLKHCSKVNAKDLESSQDVLDSIVKFSNLLQQSVFNVLRSYGYLLFSLLPHSKIWEQGNKIDEVFQSLFDIYQSQRRSNTKEALKNLIHVYESSEDFSERLKTSTLTALRNKALQVKKAFVLRTVVQHYKVFHKFQSDFIEEMVDFVDNLFFEGTEKSVFSVDITKSVLAVDIIDVILAWHKLNEDHETGKKLLSDQHSRSLIRCLLNMFCLGATKVSLGLTPVTGSDLIEKSFSILKDGFTHNFWSVNCLEIYTMFKELLETVEKEIQQNLEAQEGRIQTLICGCLKSGGPNLLDFSNKKVPSEVEERTICEKFIFDCFESRSIEIVDCITNTIIALKNHEQCNTELSDSLHELLESFIPRDDASNKAAKGFVSLATAETSILKCLLHIDSFKTKTIATQYLSEILSNMPKVTADNESILLLRFNIVKTLHFETMKPEDREDFFLHSFPEFIEKVTQSQSFKIIIAFCQFWLNNLESFDYLKCVTEQLAVVLDNKFSDDLVLISHFHGFLTEILKKFKSETYFVWTVMLGSISGRGCWYQLIQKNFCRPVREQLETPFRLKNWFLKKFSFAKCIELLIPSILDLPLFEEKKPNKMMLSFKLQELKITSVPSSSSKIPATDLKDTFQSKAEIPISDHRQETGQSPKKHVDSDCLKTRQDFLGPVISPQSQEDLMDIGESNPPEAEQLPSEQSIVNQDLSCEQNLQVLLEDMETQKGMDGIESVIPDPPGAEQLPNGQNIINEDSFEQILLDTVVTQEDMDVDESVPPDAKEMLNEYNNEYVDSNCFQALHGQDIINENSCEQILQILLDTVVTQEDMDVDESVPPRTKKMPNEYNNEYVDSNCFQALHGQDIINENSCEQILQILLDTVVTQEDLDVDESVPPCAKEMPNKYNNVYVDSNCFQALHDLERVKSADEDLHGLLAECSLFVDDLKRIKMSVFISNLIHLCYIDHCLAEYMWRQIFTKIWFILPTEAKWAFYQTLLGFVEEKVKSNLTETEVNSILSYLQATVPCMTPLPLHDVLHQHASMDLKFWCDALRCLRWYHFEGSLNQFSSLIHTYSSLDDFKYGFWYSKASLIETKMAVSKELQGLTQEAHEMYKELKNAKLPIFDQQICQQGYKRCQNKMVYLKALSKWSMQKENFTLSTEKKNRMWGMGPDLSAFHKFFSNQTRDKQNIIDCDVSTKALESCFSNVLKDYVEKLPKELSSYNELYLILKGSTLLKEVCLAAEVNKRDITINLHSGTLAQTSKSTKGFCEKLPASSTIANISKFIEFCTANNFCDSRHKLFEMQQIGIWRYKYENSFYLKKRLSGALMNCCLQYANICKEFGFENIAWSQIHRSPALNGLKKLYESIDYYLDEASMSEEDLRDYYLNAACFLANIITKKTKNSPYSKTQGDLFASYYTILAKQYIDGNIFTSFNFSSARLFEFEEKFGYYLRRQIDLLINKCRNEVSEEEIYWLCEETLYFLLKAICHADERKSLPLIALVISLFSFGNFKYLEIFLNNVPCSYWLPWIPQLVRSLSQQSTTNAKLVLEAVVKAYPQALYFPLNVLKRSRKLYKKEQELYSCMEQSNPKECTSLRKFEEELFFRCFSEYSQSVNHFTWYTPCKQPYRILNNQGTTSNSINLSDFRPGDFLRYYYENTEICFDVHLNKRAQSSRKISKILNKVEIVKNELGSDIRFYIKWDNGKIQPFILKSCLSDTYMEQTSVYQLYELLNIFLNEKRETFGKLRSPLSLLIGPHSIIVSEFESSETFLDLCTKMNTQSTGCKGFPTNLLIRWCEESGDHKLYHEIRKQFSRDLAINHTIKYLFGLGPQYPELLHIDRNSGNVAVLGLKFEILQNNIATDIPFRLTPNISRFISHGKIGYIFKDMLNAARCFHKHDVEILYYLLTIFIYLPSVCNISENEKRQVTKEINEEVEVCREYDKDKLIQKWKKKTDEVDEKIYQKISNLVNGILEKIKDLADLSSLDMNESGSGKKILQLIESSQNINCKRHPESFCKRYKCWL